MGILIVLQAKRKCEINTGYFDYNMHLSMNIQILTLIRIMDFPYGHYPVSGYNGFLYGYMTAEYVLA